MSHRIIRTAHTCRSSLVAASAPNKIVNNECDDSPCVLHFIVKSIDMDIVYKERRCGDHFSVCAKLVNSRRSESFQFNSQGNKLLFEYSIMSLIGEIPTFYPYGDDWQVYTERLEQFFELNDVNDDKKKAILITTSNSEVYKILRDVCHPVLPKDKTFDELIELLNKQYVVKTSVFRERFNFYNAKQMKDESIANWFARIKKLSVDCKFGDRFDEILLDRFISGLRASPILDRLCEEDEDKLTLQNAVEIAANKESAIKESHQDDDDEDDAPAKTRNRGGRNRRKNKE